MLWSNFYSAYYYRVIENNFVLGKVIKPLGNGDLFQKADKYEHYRCKNKQNQLLG